MPNKKKEMKDYIGLSLKIAGVSFIILILIMVLSTILNIIDVSLRLLIFEITRTIVLLSLLYFFVSVIYNQFKDKIIFWGIINTILLISGISLWGEDADAAMFPLVICFISCVVYYSKYIKPKFKKKK